ncbi:MAG: WXG100 family type VII secretion target [Eubacterium sp.]|nr:WXG100 family type VII secretion target [Eubacterium sp.]
MASIKVTPETLNSQGQELVGFSGDLADILSRVEGKINEINEGWDGLAQNAYFDMYTNMKESLDKFPELVEALGKATTGAAEAFSQVDEQLQSGFNQG